MNRRVLPVLSRFGAITAVTILLSACAVATRPAAPTPGEPARVPEGAINLGSDSASTGVAFGRSLSNALNSRFTGELERDQSGRAVFRVLALSGGGSRGAYGAGVLVGWSAAGSRPEFDVVTGISTGALVATFAFLGPEYDDNLRGFTDISNEDIFVPRNPTSALFSDALRDTAPLRALIARDIDASTLEAIAQQHAAGRRLFVGTTNLDAGTFTMWDLGGLASSDRSDKLERYRDVVLASASFPMLFPPVYIPVEEDGETRWQMHVDGSVRANVFASTFMLDLDDALERSDLGHENVRGELWVIHNGQPPSDLNEPIPPRVTAIAEAAINNLLEVTTRSGIAELYTMSMLSGFQFAYTSIPTDVTLGPSPLEFDREEMGRIFQVGFEAGRSGDAWQSQPPPSEPFELLQILDPVVVRSAGDRYPDVPHRPPRWMRVSPPVSKRVDLVLCTGGPSGNYHQIGKDVAQRLAPANVSVELRMTAGSLENLDRIRDGSCDAGIAQHDAYFLEMYGDSKGPDRLRVSRPRYLFDDFVHVVCNRSSGVRRMSDLLQEPDRHRLLIGEPRSGSRATWNVFKRLDPGYEAVPTEAIGGDAALDLVARNEAPACLFYVASLETPFMRRIDELADRLQLVRLGDPDLNNARIAGEKIYRFDRFPEGTYPRLQAMLERPDMRTLTVGSSMIVAESWAERHPQGYRLLQHAVANARRAFARRISIP